MPVKNNSLGRLCFMPLSHWMRKEKCLMSQETRVEVSVSQEWAVPTSVQNISYLLPPQLNFSLLLHSSFSRRLGDYNCSMLSVIQLVWWIQKTKWEGGTSPLFWNSCWMELLTGVRHGFGPAVVLCNFKHKMGYVLLVLGTGRVGDQLSRNLEILNIELWVQWKLGGILNGDFQEGKFEHRTVVLLPVPKSL